MYTHKKNSDFIIKSEFIIENQIIGIQYLFFVI